MPQAPLPNYAPVRIHAQVVELRRQLYIVRGVNERKVFRGQINETTAAGQLQTLQSAVRSLEALEHWLGPDAIVTTPQDLAARQAGG